MSVLAYPCPHCRSDAGWPCATATGRDCPPHTARYAEAGANSVDLWRCVVHGWVTNAVEAVHDGQAEFSCPIACGYEGACGMPLDDDPVTVRVPPAEAPHGSRALDPTAQKSHPTAPHPPTPIEKKDER